MLDASGEGMDDTDGGGSMNMGSRFSCDEVYLSRYTFFMGGGWEREEALFKHEFDRIIFSY